MAGAIEERANGGGSVSLADINPNDIQTMTNAQCASVREAMFVYGFQGATGAGNRLNQAMAANDPNSLIGDAEVLALVQQMSATIGTVGYGESITALLAVLAPSVPSTPPPAPPPFTPPPDIQGPPPTDIDAIVAAVIAKLAENPPASLSSVRDAAGAQVFGVYDKRVAHLGPSEATSKILNDLLQGVIRQAMLSVEGVDGAGDAGIIMTSGDGTMSHMIFAGGGDRGFRINYNYKQYPGGNFWSDPAYCQQGTGMETDGEYYWSYSKPQTTPAGPYDNLPGKTFKLYPGGVYGADGQRTQYVAIVSPMTGRGIDLMVGPKDPSQYETRLRVENSATEPNPCLMWLGGQLRRVTVVDGFVKVI